MIETNVTSRQLNKLIRQFKPMTEITDMEDWIKEYGVSGIVHDMLLVCVINAREDYHRRSHWIGMCNVLMKCIEELVEQEKS
jgi:hypothetical protein